MAAAEGRGAATVRAPAVGLDDRATKHAAAAPAEPRAGGDAQRPRKLFGEIRAGEFQEVLQFLGQARWSGELVVQQDESTRALFFDAGIVIGAESTDPRERVGAVLCRAGVLTPSQLDSCAAMREAADLRFGEVAVALGFVTEPALFVEMERQLESIFVGIVALASGTFQFFPEFDASRLSLRSRRTVDELLELVPSGEATIAPPPLDVAELVERHNRAVRLLFEALEPTTGTPHVREALVKFHADPRFAEFFAGWSPGADGTLDASTIQERWEALGGDEAAEERLSRALYDYASFAMFVARPHLDRLEVASMPPDGAPPPGSSPSTLRLRRFEASSFPSVVGGATARMPRAQTARLPKAHPRFVLPRAPAPPPQRSPASVLGGVRRAVVALGAAGLVLAGVAVAIAFAFPRGRRVPTSGELYVVCDPDCGSVYVDGARVTPVRGAVAVSRGPHDVVVASPGLAARHKKVTIGDDDSAAVVFELARAEPESAR